MNEVERQLANNPQTNVNRTNRTILQQFDSFTDQNDYLSPLLALNQVNQSVSMCQDNLTESIASLRAQIETSKTNRTNSLKRLTTI